MDSTALAIVLGTGLLSFVLGSLLRRWWLRRRNQRAQALLRTMQEIARERQLDAPPALNKAKRRRQERERARMGTGRR